MAWPLGWMRFAQSSLNPWMLQGCAGDTYLQNHMEMLEAAFVDWGGGCHLEEESLLQV